MEIRPPQQRLPRAGPLREALRSTGQFWTPAWVANAMVGYVLADGADHLFDPAVGAGVFFQAAKARQRHLTLLGTEIDPRALREARQNGLSDDDLSHIRISDFVLHPPGGSFKAIVANPPYLRHHRLPAGVKAQLRGFAADLIGRPLDGRAGVHVYFLLRALQLLASGGRLAFIMPADTCEGVFASTLWRWITGRYQLEAVITFAPEASPFPGVDTNALILLIKNTPPASQFFWVRCTAAPTEQLAAWVASGFQADGGGALIVHRRRLSEGVATGLSRPPIGDRPADPTLSDFARVLRGIATGANEFFVLTRRQAALLGLPHEFLLSVIGRTRDVAGDEVTGESLAALEWKGRPTWLLSLDGRPLERLPRAVREYIRKGETLGLPQRALLSTRSPWYKMETRDVPPLLFTYLGRRHSRFVRNRAGVVPLTGFLCVYPHRADPAFIDGLWQVLNHADTLANLALVGKSYGGGAIKVEPRALERLPLPAAVVAAAGLSLPAPSHQGVPDEQLVLNYA